MRLARRAGARSPTSVVDSPISGAPLNPAFLEAKSFHTAWLTDRPNFRPYSRPRNAGLKRRGRLEGCGARRFCLCRRRADQHHAVSGPPGNVSRKRDWIVDTDWLASHLDAPDLVVFDASSLAPAPTAAATRRRNSSKAISRAPCSSTSTTSRMRSRRCRTCSPPPSSSPLAHEEAGRRRRHAHRGLRYPRHVLGAARFVSSFAPWATRTSRCSTAA